MAGHADVNVIGPDSLLVQSIHAIESLYAGPSPPTSAQRLLANRALVARVMNYCFWASLAEEEGRPVSSGVTFVSPEDASDQLALAQPEPVTVESLIRLGTAAGATQTLAIHDHGGEPHIWGFVRRLAPTWVTIWFEKPAFLRVGLGSAGVLALLDRGRIFIPQGHLLANPGNLHVQLQQLLGVSVLQDVIEGLMFITNEMGRHGHGGMLLVVPPQSTDWMSHVEITRAFAPKSQSLLKGLSERLQHRDSSEASSPEALRDALIQTARRIADFTKVDGAVVIGFDLTLFGFAARVTAPDEPEERPPLLNRTIYEPDFVPADWTRLGGTRHNAAARFVATTHFASFVASHDGELSAFAWKADAQRGHVEWLRGLEGLTSTR